MGLALKEYLRDAGMAHSIWTRYLEEHSSYLTISLLDLKCLPAIDVRSSHPMVEIYIAQPEILCYSPLATPTLIRLPSGPFSPLTTLSWYPTKGVCSNNSRQFFEKKQAFQAKCCKKLNLWGFLLEEEEYETCEWWVRIPRTEGILDLTGKGLCSDWGSPRQCLVQQLSLIKGNFSSLLCWNFLSIFSMVSEVKCKFIT